LTGVGQRRKRSSTIIDGRFGSQFLQNNNERKKHMKRMTNIIYPAVTAFALACFALLPGAQAVSPPPDGGYAGGNTAEGRNALFSLTTGGFQHSG
jgi:hypothetical protein